MKSLVLVLFLCFIIGCKEHHERLPFLGTPNVQNHDTVYPKIRPFLFVNQDGKQVTDKTFENKIYVADFIFLSCPTICPKMNKELNKVYLKFKNDKDVMFLSHTIDPMNDTVERLKLYSESNNISSSKWHFVTGNKDSIYDIATKNYFSTAYKDSKEPGGYIHSGGLLLIDKNKYIRGVYDGTNPKETLRLIKDIMLLKLE